MTYVVSVSSSGEITVPQFGQRKSPLPSIFIRSTTYTVEAFFIFWFFLSDVMFWFYHGFNK